MSEQYEEPVLIFSDEMEKMSDYVLNSLRERTSDLPEDLRQGAALFASGMYEDVASGLSCSCDDRQLLTAAHLVRGLASLRAARLEVALSEEQALETMNPAAAEAFRSCYRIPSSVRQLMAEGLPQSPIPAPGVDEEGVLRHAAELLMVAQSLAKSGDPGNAITCADEVIRVIGPEASSAALKSLLARVHYSRGCALSSQRAYSRAASALEMAIQLDPGNASYYNKIGFITNHLGHYDRALEMYRMARTLDRTEDQREAAVALRGMSFALVEKGDLSQAEQALRESLAIEPGNEIAAKEIAHIYNLLDENEALGRAQAAGVTSTVKCAVCGGQFQPPGSLLHFLKRATADGEVRTVDLPNEVFGVPLVIECPLCRRSVRLSRYTPHGLGAASIESIAVGSSRGLVGIGEGLASTAHPAADPERAARLNLDYIKARAEWQALPWWKRLTTKKPMRPTEI